MGRVTVRKPDRRHRPYECGRMMRLVFWTACGVALGLAHIHLRLATRDMEIQRGRLQAEWEELWDRQGSLASGVARLRGGDRMLDYAHRKLGLVELPADQIEVWKFPRDAVERYDRAFSDIALARMGEAERVEPEPLVARLLGAVLSPEVQARPASQGR